MGGTSTSPSARNKANPLYEAMRFSRASCHRHYGSTEQHLLPGTCTDLFLIVWIVTGSRMNCRVTTVEGLPRRTGLNSSGQVFQRSLIGVPLSGVASSARQDTIPVSPGISHNLNAGISLETRRLQTQQTGVFRHCTPKARWTNKFEQQA